jgi:predicted dehydrogenase
VLPRAGILIGCGSVGKKHALAMARRYRHVIIVDPHSGTEEWVKSNISVDFQIFKDISDVPIAEISKVFALTAVIATWGPSHAVILEKLVNCGIKRIVCEKPFTNSILSAKLAADLAELHNVRIVVGVTRRYTGLAMFLNKTLLEHCGGPAEMIVVSGGAQCVATVGIHWLDLAFQLFGTDAINVMASLRDGGINPRASTLGYWEGTATWQFNKNKFLSINLSNSSRVAAKVEITGKWGCVTIEPTGDIVVSRIQLDDLEKLQPITRTKALVKHETINPKEYTTVEDPFLKQLEIADGKMSLPYSLNDAIKVLNAMIGAFESSLHHKEVILPIIKESDAYSRAWQIS